MMDAAAPTEAAPSGRAGGAQLSQTAILLAGIWLVVHGAAAVLVLQQLPQGFPWGHVKFVANTAVPWAGLSVGAIALGLLVRRQSRLLLACAIALCAAWCSGGFAAVGLFSVSLPRAGWFFVAVGVTGLALVGIQTRRNVLYWPELVVALLIGASVGVLVALAQRAPAATTHPGFTHVLEGPPSWTKEPDAAANAANVGVAEFDAASATLDVRCGDSVVAVRPLLTFDSRSPDRTWTSLAPPSSHGSHRRLDRAWRTSAATYAKYSDDGHSTLLVTQADDGFVVDAQSDVPTDIYSHLNSFTSLQFAGTGAQLAFSATGDTWFDIVPADYPTGRPARMATLYADGRLRVVEASDGEKGPFHTLAEGMTSNTGPLILRLRLASGAECSFEFADWAAQASTALSPSAGWGMPQNSIQFFAGATHSLILFTLADTGPGRGWESVGHAHGGYRNRVRVRQ